MGRNLKLLITLFVLTVLYGAYYLGIPALVNLPEKAGYIEETVLKEYGYKISLKNPHLKMGFTPAVWIKAENFAILNNDNTNALNIENPVINIKLLPLIFKKIDIGLFSAENMDVNLVFTKDSELKLGQYGLSKKLNSPFKLNHACINLNGYNINLDDKFQSKDISLNGDYLIVKDFSNDKHINLSTSAKLQTGEKTSYLNTDIDLELPLNKIFDDKLEISGHIINLNLADFSAYAKALSKNKINSISGLVNFTADTIITEDKHKQIKTSLYIKNFGIYKKDLSTSVYSKGKIEIKTDINTIKNGLDINEMRITAEGIKAFCKGKITGLNNKIPNLDLKISINQSKAENIVSLLPAEHNLCPDINFFILKQAGFWGKTAGNLEIKGKADFPDIFGNIIVWDAYMVKPIKNAEKAVIKIAFKGQKLDLDVKVPTSPTETVYVKGPINLYHDKYADLMITSSENVDLKTAQIVLNPLHDILHFDLGPVPIMDIQGKGGINLHVIGTRENPHGWGQFRFKNATVSFLDIHNMVLTNGSGTLDFDNQNTLFQTKTASFNGKPVSVRGTCSLSGVLDFTVKTAGQDLGNLIKIIKTSPMLADIQKMTESIEIASGASDFFLNLTGKVKDPKDIVFNKNIFAKGYINLHSAAIKLKGLPAKISNTSGVINFNNLDADFKLNSYLNKSEILTTGKIKDSDCDIKISSSRFKISDGLSSLPQSSKIPYGKDLGTVTTSFFAAYKGDINKIDYNKIFVDGKIYPNKGAKSAIITNGGNFTLNNAEFKIPELKGTFNNSPFEISLYASNVFNQKRIINGRCNIGSFDLNTINDTNLLAFLPADISKNLNDIKFLNGKVNIKARAKNNNIMAYIPLNDISILYKPKRVKLLINSGDILLNNDIVNLNKINVLFGNMPIFVNGKISNIHKTPSLNLYLNTKLTQEFFDQYINNKAVYPIKLKGDIIFTSKANGIPTNLNTDATLNIDSNSSLYYMGASIGDIENPVKITVNSDYSPNRLRINKLQYDKIITSQNNKPYKAPQLSASGSIKLLADNIIGFDNFKIKTQTPTDAKIFNIIFRKPFMKQGVFTSDLTLNGTSLNPKINGKFEITSIDIPFFNSTIRDVNLDFKHDKIYITGKGTVITNDVLLNAIMKNNLTPPYVVDYAKLQLADLDINKITDTLRDNEAEATRNPSLSSNTIEPFDINQLVINNADIEADKIKVRNINADDFIANFNFDKNGEANIKNFSFDIAEGSVNGKFRHNINTHKTNLDINLDRANALIMSEALFDLKGQVYGSVNGSFKLNCTGDTQDCFKTLSGEGTFKITDGRMPKLGSLEYLLKAGNLLKGGFTGLSINSLIDLVTPLKTGDFESISGDIHIADGIADNINIYSNGNDLNMYMTGNYNLTTSVADMKIYGSLSKNITTVFGKIKNASLNTLFNTIPGINSQTEKLLLQTDISKIPDIKNATDIYRIFAVDINGDINGENYVKSFKWVK